MRVDHVKFLNEYIKAIRNRRTSQDLAKKLGISYVRVLQLKKNITDMTGKQLPPLVSPRQMINIDKINKLVEKSYNIHKIKNNNSTNKSTCKKTKSPKIVLK